MKLILPFPPSVNTYWRHPNKGAFAGKSLISAAGRKFQSAACAAIVEQLRRLPKPTSAPASVEIVLFPPDIGGASSSSFSGCGGGRAEGFGAGGGGACAPAGSEAQSGGDGAPGIVIVEEYA